MMDRRKRAENVIMVTNMIPVRYRAKDIEWLREKYWPGRRITVMRVREDGEECLKQRRRRHTVEKAYPCHVSCVDQYGIRESFNYFELEQVTV